MLLAGSVGWRDSKIIKRVRGEKKCVITSKKWYIKELDSVATMENSLYSLSPVPICYYSLL